MLGVKVKLWQLGAMMDGWQAKAKPCVASRVCLVQLRVERREGRVRVERRGGVRVERKVERCVFGHSIKR